MILCGWVWGCVGAQRKNREHAVAAMRIGSLLLVVHLIESADELDVVAIVSDVINEVVVVPT